MFRRGGCGWLCVGVMFVLGCATSFEGKAKFPNGPNGCFHKCKSVGMVMSSFVYVGEYSTGCVCTLQRSRDKPTAGGEKIAADQAATAATGAAAVGVVLQQRAMAGAVGGVAGAILVAP